MDDLVKRLREYCDGNNDLMDAAADCIEELLKFKMFRSAADKVALEVDQKLVNQLGAAHKRNKELEAALRQLAKTDLTGVAIAALGEKKDAD